MNHARSLGGNLWGKARRSAPWILAAICLLLVRESGLRVAVSGWDAGRPVAELRFPGWEPKAQTDARKAIEEVEFLMGHRQPQIASQVLLAALDRHPDNVYLAVRLEEVLLEMGDWDRARRLLDEIEHQTIPTELTASVQAARAKFRERAK